MMNDTKDSRPVASCYNDGQRIVARISISDVSYLQRLNNILMNQRQVANLTENVIESVKKTGSIVHLFNSENTKESSGMEGGAPSGEIDDVTFDRVELRIDQTAFANSYESLMLKLENLTPHQVHEFKLA